MKKLLFYLLAIMAIMYCACNSNSTGTNNHDSTSTMNASSNTNSNNNNEDAREKRNEQVVLSLFDNINTMFNSFMTAFPDFTIQNPKAVADGDTVMVWATDIGTWKGDLMGHKP